MTQLDRDPTVSEDGELLSYYEFMGISENENDLKVIKQKYKKLAQIYHPDKLRDSTLGDKPFKYLQNAYNTLIDNQKRAIYDKNRKILTDPFQYTSTFLNINHFYAQIDGLDVQSDMNTFCKLVQGFIKQLFEEEMLSARSQIKSISSTDKKYQFLKNRLDNPLPQFGDQSTDISEVLKFYNKMKGFCTVKLMSFANVYSLDGYNSAERYYVNQINQQQRDQEVDKFNQQIQELFEYLKTKDQRVILYQQNKKIQEQQNREAYRQEQEQQKIEKEEKAKRINQERKERLQFLQEKLKDDKLTPEEMLEFERLTIKPMTSRQNREEQLKQEQKNKTVEKEITLKDLISDQSLIDQGLALDSNKKLYCTICLQRFGMAGEFKNHLNSKRHKKAMSEKQLENNTAEDQKDESNGQRKGQKNQKNKQKDEDINPLNGNNEESSSGFDDFKGKNKKNKQQKNIQGNSRQVDPKFQCLKCKQTFESRTKLFNHIKETGHAAPKK